MEYYVYEHWRPDTGLPFYVGKGKGRRAYGLDTRSIYHKRVSAKLKNLGLKVEVRKVFTYLDESMAFALEAAQIAYWKARGIKLINATDGGEGSSGYKHKPELRALFVEIGRSSKGRKHTVESRNKISVSMRNRGYRHSEETCQKIGNKNKGRVQSDETRRKRSLTLLAFYEKQRNQSPHS